MIIISSTFRDRFEVKKFCVDAVNLLREAKVPVLWTMKMTDRDFLTSPNEVDIIKNLVSQALRLNISIHNEEALSVSCARFRGAETADQWLELLGSVLIGMPVVYIILDVEAVHSHYARLEGSFLWVSEFQELFNKMADRGYETAVKLALISYGSEIPLIRTTKEIQSAVMMVRRPGNAVPIGKRGSQVSQGRLLYCGSMPSKAIRTLPIRSRSSSERVLRPAF